MADDAGALLVRTGLISDQALVAARASCSAHGGTIGEHLVITSAVSDEALTEFFRSRLLVPKVNPNTLARLGVNVIEAIPADMAIEFRVVPVALDQEGNLTIAMSDPSDRHAVDEIGFFTGKYVVRAVATQMQIAWCLAHYYGHITELGQRLLRPSADAVPAPPPSAPSAPLPRARGLTGRVDAARHKAMPPVMVQDLGAPRPSDRLLTPTAEDLQRIAAAREGAVAAARAAEATEPTGPILVAELAASNGAPDAEAPPAISEPYEAVQVEAAQVHVSLLTADESPPTPPRGTPPRPQRKVVPDPPELAARTGEVEVHDAGRVVEPDLPAVVIEPEPEPAVEAVPPRPAATIVDDDDTAPHVDDVPLQAIDDDDDDDAAVIHDIAGGTESRPIMLVQRTPARLARDTVEDSDDDDEPFVLLERRKTDAPATSSAADSIAGAVDSVVRAAAARRRPERRTQIGVGLPEVAPRPSRAVTAEETAAATASVSAAAAAAASAMEAVPVPVAPAVTAPGHTAAAAAAALLSSAAAAVRRPVDAPITPRAARRPAVAAEARTPGDGIPSVIDDGKSDASTRPHYAPPLSADVDEGWGAPGTTIPPPFLGAMPGTESGPIPDANSIPISSDADDQPALLVAKPAPPTAAPTTSRPTADPGGIARELERASTKLVELLRALDRATTRDEAVEFLITFLSDSHERAAFLTMKGGQLSPFVQRPPSPRTAPQLALDVPSTFQDVVGTRLPYRGALEDAAAREFVQAAFGVPATEALILPIAVRDRVVALLYGDGRRRHTFDEHFAIAGRAAGLALERILQTRRSTAT